MIQRLDRDEQGQALVMALGILVVLTIALTATLELTGAAPRHAGLQNADAQAYGLAEAGVNDAVAELSRCGAACSLGLPPAYAGDPGATTEAFSGGTVTFGGTYDANKIWTIKAIGAVRNPTGPTAAAVTRTVTAQVQLNPPPITFTALNPSCDNHTLVVKLGGHLTVSSNVYVNSCSTEDGFDLFGTGGTFAAPAISTFGGWETHDGSTVIVNGVTCVPQPVGTTKIAPPDPVPPWPGCPKTGQPLVTDPLQSQITTPALGVSAWGGPSPPVSVTGVVRSGNVATLKTATSTVAAGDSVTVSGVGSGFDGTYTVLGTPAPTATSFSYSNPGANVSVTITQKQLTSGTATLTTSQPHMLAPGDSVTVAGVDGVLNGTYTVASLPSPTSFTYARARAAFTRSTGKVGLQSGTATLTLNADATHPVVNGDIFGVAGYTGANAVLNGGPFTAASSTLDPLLAYANPATSVLTLTSQPETIAAGTTVTITTPPNNLTTGDTIVVSTDDPRVNGTFTLTVNPGGNQAKYTLPAALSATVTGGSITGGVATMTTQAAPPFHAADAVTVSTGDTRFDGVGTVTVTGVDAAAKTFSFTPDTFKNDAPTSWSYNSGTRTVTMFTASLQSIANGDAIRVSGFGGAQTCMNNGGATVSVFGVNAATKQFSYVVPAAVGTCTPGASGNQKATIAYITVAAASPAGTATLTTGASWNVNGTITVPGFIAANTAVACANCISATGNIAATALSPAGTYTSSGQPAFVAVAAGSFTINHVGGATQPALYTVSASGPQNLSQGTYYGGLCIGVPNGTSCNSANCKTADGYAGVNYNPAQTGTIAATGSTVSVTAGGGTAIQNGDYVLMDSEKMLVTAGGGTASLTVARAQLGTTAAAHTAKPIKYIVGTPSVALNDGTYIMAGGGFFVCGAAAVSAPRVLIVNTTDTDPVTGTVYAALNQIQLDTTGTITLGPQLTGQYQGLTIYQPVNNAMSSFSAAPFPLPGQKLVGPINDTQTTITTDNTAITDSSLIYIDSEVIRVVSGGGTTSLVVTRGVQGSDTQAPHANGAVIKQVTGQKCDGRSAALTDILFSAIGNGLNGLSGSIYAPHPYSLFADSVSGTADLAVMTGCLFINGADSTFSFQPTLHFGSGSVTLLNQSG